jgi:hypothetical protein
MNGERGIPGMFRLGWRDVGLLNHPVKDIGLAFAGFFQMFDGRIGVGRLGQTGQQGHLGQVELINVLSEIGLGRRLDAIGPRPHIDLIEVNVEDLVLGEPLLHALGQDGFLDLAGELLLRGQQH